MDLSLQVHSLGYDLHTPTLPTEQSQLSAGWGREGVGMCGWVKMTETICPFTSLLPTLTLVPQVSWGAHRTGTELVSTAFAGHVMEMEVISNTLCSCNWCLHLQNVLRLAIQQWNAHISRNTDRYVSLKLLNNVLLSKHYICCTESYTH